MERRTFLGALAATQAPAAHKYRAAVIGHTGRGNFGHGWDSAFTGFPQIEVVAAADPVESGRFKAQKASGAARAYADYREMLRREKPDLVAICPRTLDQRLEMFTAVAETGAHILMEKPFSRDLVEADQMVALAERKKVKVQVGHTARPTPVTRRAAEMARNGTIGRLLEMRARGKEDQRAGGEDMMVLGSHLFDMMRMVAGDPRWVFAHVTQDGREVDRSQAHEATEPLGPIAGDEVASVFWFESGVHGYFSSRPSDVRSGERFGLALYCSKGVIFVPTTQVPGAPPDILLSNSWTTGTWRKIDHDPDERRSERGGANAMMVRDLLEAIEKDREPVCSARDARWTIEMVMGVYQSQRTGRRVEFPLKDRRHPLAS